MNLLTFLGAPNKPYTNTTYLWQDQAFTTPFAPLASCHFLNINRMTVFLTEDAQEKTYPQLQAALPPGMELVPVAVPSGSNEKELWQLFNTISEYMLESDTVAFDITFGYRSFHIISLLLAAYLRASDKVKLQAVLYGAFEASTPAGTPMFDLSPMLKLLEWASASDRFNRTGDARYLASLLREQQKLLATAPGEARTQRELAGRLGSLGSALGDISQGLHLIRPHQVMARAASLPRLAQDALPALDALAAARPFSLLLDDITATFSPLAYAAPNQAETLAQSLEVERQMIRWYAERELWVQAASLGREWLVSWTMYQQGLQTLTSKDARQSVSDSLGDEAKLYKNKSELPPETVFMNGLTHAPELLSLWLALTDVRNDIDHAGMRDEPYTADTLVKNLKKCLERLYALQLERSL